MKPFRALKVIPIVIPIVIPTSALFSSFDRVSRSRRFSRNLQIREIANASLGLLSSSNGRGRVTRKRLQDWSIPEAHSRHASRRVLFLRARCTRADINCTLTASHAPYLSFKFYAHTSTRSTEGNAQNLSAIYGRARETARDTHVRRHFSLFR